MDLRRILGLWVCLAPLSGLSAETLLIRGGKIVDGTGAPWYRGDLLIAEGRIAAMGPRLDSDDPESTKVIEADGAIVAPGFIDMMGQSATPMLDDPESAKNLLAQGITTINAGEGASAAPLSEEAGLARGWTTLGEYFHLLEMRGLPLNVVQTVGHTQVRRLVMGDEDRVPTNEEMESMKAHVRQAMRDGAIGLSTALIYPPAVFADTEEIGALAEVAGEHGGRYYTHMRNEGDQLLEAIDEALAIGKRGQAPVHIFHLKAAGRRNWPSMALALNRIEEARAEGQEVAADIYPYVNNGLRIPALIHPRHFADGWPALLSRIDDKALRATIRREMEADSTDWENWYQHIGRDWEKLIVGKANNVRFDRFSGQSLAAIAEASEMAPWDLFFALVKTDAFVLPESMSEANKHQAMRKPYISFCTDVGPFGGSSSASHPRGFGAFARLIGKYVNQEQVISLERTVAQASALAANEVLAFDRGRLAVGLAADVIIFDAESFVDKATFAEPYALAEGMQQVIVNGELVFENGEQTKALPGRVLRGPGYRESDRPANVSQGECDEAFTVVDEVMRELLATHPIPGAALAITEGSQLVYAKGYGYANLAKREPASPESLFRIASISKPVTATAILRLVEDDKLSLDDKVFDLLDGYEPVSDDLEVDPRLKEITVAHLLRHEGGWDRSKSFDAMFRAIDFAEAVGSPPPADPDEVIINMLTQTLDFDPGTRQSYSNFGYSLLGRLIEEVSGQDYEAFVRDQVLAPVGAHTMRLGRSFLRDRAPGEVRYYSPYRGPSVFAENLRKRVPYPYGGWHLEAMDSHGAWLASAVDLARFAVAFDRPEESPVMKAATWEQMHATAGAVNPFFGYVLGWGKRHSPAGAQYSHSGSLAGTSTLLVRRPDGRNWVVLFNGRSGPKASRFSAALQKELDPLLDELSATKPAKDLFASFPKHTPK